MLPSVWKRPTWTMMLTIGGLFAGSGSTLDVRMATAQAPSAETAPTDAETPALRAYDVGGQDPTVVAARLQTQLPGDAGISVAADKRTGRVLVLASPAAHRLIGTLIAAPAPAVPAAQVPTEAAKPTAEKKHTLKSVDGANFEAALAALAGRKLPVTVDAAGKNATYTLTGRDGAATMLNVDRKAGVVTITGTADVVDGWLRVVTVLDRPAKANAADLEEVVPIRNADIVANGSLQQAMRTIAEQVGPRNVPTQPANQLVSMMFQPLPAPEVPAAPATNPGAVAEAAAQAAAASGALSGPVSIQYIESLDLLVIRGNSKDVERVKAIIAEIERESAFSVPKIEIHQLKNVGSEAMANLIRPLYDQVLSTRQGRVSVTSLVKPNALLLIGREDSIKVVVDLIERLDTPVDPDSEFKIIELKHTAATEMLQTVQAALSGQTVGGTGTTGTNVNQGVLSATTIAPGLGTRAVVTADYRTNSLIVRASGRDLIEIEALIKRLDKSSSEAVNDLKVFNLKYSLAEELAPVLQSAVTGTAQQNRNQQQGGQGQPFGQAGQQLQQLQQGGNQQNQQQRAARSIMLQFLTVDEQGKKLLKSGLLTDVRITADGRANSVIVSAPAESIELIGALIRELDQMPTAEAQIKVFTIQNGDAANLVTMLQSLFGLAATGGAANQRGGGGGANFNFGGATGGDTSGDNPLVGLRFSVDQRTNSIIVSGSAGDLGVVEAILLRLDESDIRQRKSTVYRLRNAPAVDVANSINQLLNSERQLQQVAPQSLSPFQQIEKEVVVVPEIVSNSLIISATPRYFDEIRAIIEQLDMQPPMINIQVLIAEVQLSNNDEFGVELGVQDSVLFDRSLLGNLVTTTNSTTFGNPATTVQNQVVQAATNTPGYNFVGNDLGNSGSTQSLAQSGAIGSQGTSSFGVGRTNSELGFGGLVLSASSESLSVLLRALSQNRRLEVLSRPQIMTLDNQPAFIQVGQRVPRITNVSVNLGIQNNSIVLENVGLILGVTPRTSPDGLVVMEIDAERSEVGPDSEGVPIFVNTTGQVVRSPRFNTSVAQTTVSAASGQTIILGGLISKTKTEFSRRAPFLSDIPVLGHLFRYDSSAISRRELLIIMTPRVVRTQQDAELIKQVESARMSWCLADVMRIHGPSGLKTRKDHWGEGETLVVYPDANPNCEVPPVLYNDPADAAILPPGTIMQQHAIPGENGTFSKPLPEMPGPNGPQAPPPQYQPPVIQGAGVAPRTTAPTVQAATRNPGPSPTIAPGEVSQANPAAARMSAITQTAPYAPTQPAPGATQAAPAQAAPPQPSNSAFQAMFGATQPTPPPTFQAQQAVYTAPQQPAPLPANWGQAPLEIDAPSAQTAVYYGSAPQAGGATAPQRPTGLIR